MVRPATLARNRDSRTLPSRSGRMTATTSFIQSSSYRDAPHPPLRGTFSPLGGAKDLAREGGPKGRVRGSSFSPPIQEQNRPLAVAVGLLTVLGEVEAE